LLLEYVTLLAIDKNQWIEKVMSVELTYPHIEKPSGEPARLGRVPRVRVAQVVMDYLAHGWSPDEMCRQHPYLKLAEAHAAMAYYFDHQEEIDLEIREEWLRAEAAKNAAVPSHFLLRMRARGLV
jgi:uncharacterized protein (DUF433 family)